MLTFSSHRVPVIIFIASVLVAGGWLLFAAPVDITSNSVAQVSENSRSPVAATLSNLQVNARTAINNTGEQQNSIAAAVSSQADTMNNTVNENDTQSDADWFAALMRKAAPDRVINIEITGSSVQSAATGVNVGIHADNDEADAIADTDTALAANKVDCPSVMYMNGNAYGRNMLIKMGCAIP